MSPDLPWKYQNSRKFPKLLESFTSSRSFLSVIGHNTWGNNSTNIHCSCLTISLDSLELSDWRFLHAHFLMGICRPPQMERFHFIFYYFSGHPEKEPFSGRQRRWKVKEEQLVGQLFWAAGWDGKKRRQRASWSYRDDKWLKQGAGTSIS